MNLDTFSQQHTHQHKLKALVAQQHKESLIMDKYTSMWRPKVLLLEGDTLTQKIHRDRLESIGCHIDVAKSGLMCLEMFSEIYDMVIADIDLPNLNGIEICIIIRQFSHKTPVWLITNQYDERTKNLCMRAGGNYISTKPIPMTDFKSTFKKLTTL